MKKMEIICSEKTSVTSNNKELYKRCKYSKEIENSKDRLQSCINNLSTNTEINRC